MNSRRCCVCALIGMMLVQTTGCALNKDMNSELEVKPHSKEYSPGFTGYSTGYGGYGGYLNGFGPSFWNPRYVYYTGYGQGYSAGN